MNFMEMKELETAREEMGGTMSADYDELLELTTQYPKTTLRRVKA